MPSTCLQCRHAFEVTDTDLAFYDRVSPVFGGQKESVPPPTLCPDCRMQRRLSFRNERGLHHRVCDRSGKSIISMYSASVPFPVYENAEWWRDGWDGRDFGREFDFSRPFFAQFRELFDMVPKMARVQQGENVNSQYCNCASNNKDCYLMFSANKDDDCLYGTWVTDCRSCVDSYGTFRCELCHDCVNCVDCYGCRSLQDCTNCSDSAFLKDCVGCKDCFGCVNLRNKRFCVLNEQLTEEEYRTRMNELRLSRHSMVETARSIVRASFLTFPRKDYQGHSNEDSTGNYILHCRRTYDSYDVEDLEDCRYCTSIQNAKDAYDLSYYGSTGTNELLLEGEGVGHGTHRVLFCKLVWGNAANVLYSYECFGGTSLFGCAGLQKRSHCILNKQYTPEEYASLVPKIIAHMRSTGEWGEFFPSSLSPFGYQETTAQEHFPRTREEARAGGFTVREQEAPKDTYRGPVAEIPEDIQDVPDAVCAQIHRCAVTGAPYKITPQELRLYRLMRVPLPRTCPDQRHADRLALRTPRRLWSRACAKCSAPIKTTYAPDLPEIVYCERCYLQTVL